MREKDRFIGLKCTVFALGFASCAQVVDGPIVFESGATDEAWETLSAAAPVADAMLAPRLETTMLDSSSPTLRWSEGQIATRPTIPKPETESSVLAILKALVLPARAYAHLPPVSGPMYRLALESCTYRHRVLTGATEHTVAGFAWQKLTEDGSPVRYELVGSSFRYGTLVDAFSSAGTLELR